MRTSKRSDTVLVPLLIISLRIFHCLECLTVPHDGPQSIFASSCTSFWMDSSKTVATIHRLSPDLSPRMSASFAGMPLVARGEATDASFSTRQRLVSGPHSGLVARRLARATCPPIPARTSPPFCRKRKVSTKALLRLSACTPARSPLYVSVPNFIASQTTPMLLLSCLGGVVSLPRVFFSALPRLSSSDLADGLTELG